MTTGCGLDSSSRGTQLQAVHVGEANVEQDATDRLSLDGSSASAAVPAVRTSNFSWPRNRRSAWRIGSSSSTTSTVTGVRVGAGRGSGAVTDQPMNSTWTRVGISPAPAARSSSSLHGAPPDRAVVHRPLVDVHPDEGVGAFIRRARGCTASRATALPPRWASAYSMLARTSLATWAITSRRPRSRRTTLPPSGSGRPVSRMPPGAEILPEVEPGVGVGELPFMDQQARPRRRPRSTAVLDLVERHDHRVDVRLVELERQVGGGEEPRDGDLAPAERRARVGRRRLARHQPRAVAVAHRGAGRQQGVPVRQVGVGVDRDRRDLELAAPGALVEASRYRSARGRSGAAVSTLPVGERVEHERVVGVGAVGDVDGPRRVRCSS